MDFIVMRRPCLMEDEGRTEFIKAFELRGQAQAWIDDQHGQYFPPSDYYILVSKEEMKRQCSRRRA